MKCNKCGSEWNSTVKSELCPFCGETLEMKKDLKTIDDVFTFIFSEYGIEIINEHRRFVAMLSDYAPQMNNERNLIKIALESGAYSSLVDANDKDFDEQQICFKRVQSMLEQLYFLSSDWAQKVLIWLTNYLGWSIKVEKLSNAEINSIKETHKSDTPAIEAYLKRVFIFLNDGEWKKADEYCEKILDINPECADAYLGKLMIDLHIKSESVFTNIKIDFENNKNYQKIIAFGDTKINQKLKDILERIKYEKKEEERQRAKAEAEIKQKEIERENERKRQKEENLLAVAIKHATLKQKREKSMIMSKFLSSNTGTTIGLKSNGTVVAVGDNDAKQLNLSNWSNIRAVSAGPWRAVGLKYDGTVIAAGNNDEGECNVNHWQNVVSISAGDDFTVGLKSNGTVVTCGSNLFGQRNVNKWINIVDISAGVYHTVGLKSDGTVIAVGNNSHGQCNVSSWTDIVSISAGDDHTVALKSDGTVVAVGSNYYNECNVSNWRDIVSISAGNWHTVGLKSDGSVVSTMIKCHWNNGQCNVSNWKDIIAVFASDFYTLGLKSNGTVVAVGKNVFGACNIEDWKLFSDMDNIEEEQTFERKKLIEEKKRMAEKQAEYRSKNLCQYCGGTFKGFFKEKCSVCNKVKDY